MIAWENFTVETRRKEEDSIFHSHRIGFEPRRTIPNDLFWGDGIGSEVESGEVEHNVFVAPPFSAPLLLSVLI